MADHLLALEPGTLLEEYRIDRILGQGGFGITYLANDTKLGRLVALKEYMPREVATRDATRTVRPLTSHETTEFNWGLDRFVDEARVLAQLEHPNIVRVLRILEGHGTAYMVMRYEQGDELGRLLKVMSRQPNEEELIGIVHPILDALERVHENGFLHRDVKPANIFLRDDGSPVLLDFGAARQAVREHSRSVTSIASEGYAPYEQYSTDGRSQGPWTDLYGLAAVMYRVVTGQTPVGAQTRSIALIEGEADPLVPVHDLVPPNTYSAALLNAISAGLSYRTSDRPRSAAAFRALLEGTAKCRAAPAPPVAPRQQPSDDGAVRPVSEPLSFGNRGRTPPPSPTEGAAGPRRWVLPAAIGVVVLMLAAAGIWVATKGGTQGSSTPRPADPGVPPQTSPDAVRTMVRQAGQQVSVVRRSLGELRATEVKLQALESIPNPSAQVLSARNDLEAKKRFYLKDIQDQTDLYLAQLVTLRSGDPAVVDAALDASQARAETMPEHDTLLKLVAVLRQHVLTMRTGNLTNEDITSDLSPQ